MKTAAVITTLFSTVAFAIPAMLVDRQAYVPCTGLYGTAQCCATDVLGIADLNCFDPSAVPTSAANFQALCAAEGQQAKCCVLSILGQDVLCETPTGVDE